MNESNDNSNEQHMATTSAAADTEGEQRDNDDPVQKLSKTLLETTIEEIPDISYEPYSAELLNPIPDTIDFKTVQSIIPCLSSLN